MLAVEAARRCEFDQIRIGDRAGFSVTLAAEDLDAFAALSGDCNPLHMDGEFARARGFRGRVAHGMLVGSYISRLVGMYLPGEGALWTEQRFHWRAPVHAGDTLALNLAVTHKSSAVRAVQIEVKAMNQDGNIVMEGTGTVVLPEERRQEGELPIAERVAWISGSSAGIGAAVASALGRAGAPVVVNYLRRAAAAEEVCHAICAGGGRAIAVRADVADPVAVAAAADTAVREFGKPVDILVHSAAPPRQPRAFLETGWQDFAAQIDVQVRGCFHCCQAVLPGMAARKSGCIVAIGAGVNWSAPPPHHSAWALAKAALKSLTRSLAVEFGPAGVRVNMVSPGMAETESTSNVPLRVRKLEAMHTPLRRLCTPEDVARAVIFLCSPAGSFITGADLPVSGGFFM